MQFIYEQNASKKRLLLTGESYHYLFRVRRLKVGEIIRLKNLKDEFLYLYRVESISKKEAVLHLEEKVTQKIVKNSKKLHILWCIIDTKTIQKSLPMLNQIGVWKISFIYCQRSQKNFKIDIGRLKKILINSNQQCNRAEIMEIEILSSLEDAVKIYNNFTVLDFGGQEIDLTIDNISSILIGCEGGFTQSEQNLLQNYPKVSFKTNQILKSETATIAIASKLIL